MPGPFDRWIQGPLSPGSTNSLAFSASAIPMGNFVNSQFNQISQNPFAYYNGGGTYNPAQGYQGPSYPMVRQGGPVGDAGFLGNMANTIQQGLNSIQPTAYTIGGFGSSWGGGNLNGASFGGGYGMTGQAPMGFGMGQGFGNGAAGFGQNGGISGMAMNQAGPIEIFAPTSVTISFEGMNGSTGMGGVNGNGYGYNNINGPMNLPGFNNGYNNGFNNGYNSGYNTGGLSSQDINSLMSLFQLIDGILTTISTTSRQDIQQLIKQIQQMIRIITTVVHTYTIPPNPSIPVGLPTPWPPQPTYWPPQPTYWPPQPTYWPPQPTYWPPQPTYWPPQPTYWPPFPTITPQPTWVVGVPPIYTVTPEPTWVVGVPPIYTVTPQPTWVVGVPPIYTVTPEPTWVVGVPPIYTVTPTTTVIYVPNPYPTYTPTTTVIYVPNPYPTYTPTTTVIYTPTPGPTYTPTTTATTVPPPTGSTVWTPPPPGPTYVPSPTPPFNAWNGDGSDEFNIHPGW